MTKKIYGNRALVYYRSKTLIGTERRKAKERERERETERETERERKKIYFQFYFHVKGLDFLPNRIVSMTSVLFHCLDRAKETKSKRSETNEQTNKQTNEQTNRKVLHF